LLAGAIATATWPMAARGQQPLIPLVGFLNTGFAARRQPHAAAFRRGLNELGYVEGRSVAIEYRWADGHIDRLPALAADLVHRNVAAIAAVGGDGPALAAKAATSTIPIVFNSSSDPIEIGLVAGLNRPGGNLTGISRLTMELGPKR